MYKRYLKDFKEAADEAVKYAEWSIFWIKYKNCQNGQHEPYCGNLDANWVKDCNKIMNPFVSSVSCKFVFIGGNLGCKKNGAGSACVDARQKNIWGNKEGWHIHYCDGHTVPSQNICSNKKGRSKWTGVGIYSTVRNK